MASFTVTAPRGFRLKAAAEFYGDFTPGCGMAVADANSQRLTFAFRLDHSFEAVAVSLQHDGAQLRGEVAGTDDVNTAKAQVMRMLGLHVDGDAWWALGARDPVVGRLQHEMPGFFTAAKASPYDAAAWGLISPRMSMKQAAAIKMRMAALHGNVVTLHDRTWAVFPSPSQLQDIDSVVGLAAVKLDRLKALGLAALGGALNVDTLRALPEHEALRALQTLPGVGPWTASHILYRGAALQDALPVAEPRVLHGLGSALGLDRPVTAKEFIERGAQWRPFGMWVCVLLARHLGRVGGWHNPSLRQERAKASKRLMDVRQPSLV